jgi:hypothetical protein
MGYQSLLAQAFGPHPDMVRTTHAGQARPPPRPPHEQRLPRRPALSQPPRNAHISDAGLTADRVQTGNMLTLKAPSDAVVFCVMA